MTWLAAVGSWISENESLLSGLAAMIVVAGVVLSPLGAGLRRVWRRDDERRRERERSRAEDLRARGRDSAESPSTVRPVVPGTSPARLTFKGLTAASSYETKFADSGGIRIAWNERGHGPPDIVCAPGIISHLNLVENLPATRGTLEALARFGRVVTFDKRGQGLSDPVLSTPGLEERTLDIAAVMDAAEIERGVLLGYSEGGPMCLHFAHAHPERVQGLILVGTAACWVQSSDYPIGIPRTAIEGLSRAWGTGALRDVFFPSISREQMDDDTYRAFEKLIGTRTAIRQLTEMMIETDVRPLLPAIEVPALVVHFTGDLAVPIRLGRALAEGLPLAEFLEVNAVDHADISQSDVAVDRIRAFCERVGGRT